MMKKFSSRFKESIPHITLILSLMLTVFLIVDQFNRAMAFINLLNTNEELLNLVVHGEEGKDWNWVDKDKKLIEEK